MLCIHLQRSGVGEKRVGGGGEENPRTLGLASLGTGKPWLVSQEGAEAEIKS